MLVVSKLIYEIIFPSCAHHQHIFCKINHVMIGRPIYKY